MRPLMTCSRKPSGIERRSARSAVRLHRIRIDDSPSAVGTPLRDIHGRVRLAGLVELDGTDHTFVADAGERIADLLAVAHRAGLLHRLEGHHETIVGLCGEAVRFLAELR